LSTLAAKKKIRAGFDMSDRTIPLSEQTELGSVVELRVPLPLPNPTGPNALRPGGAAGKNKLHYFPDKPCIYCTQLRLDPHRRLIPCCLVKHRDNVTFLPISEDFIFPLPLQFTFLLLLI
jgi:hypothetical protein